MTDCPFVNIAGRIEKEVSDWPELEPLKIIGDWHGQLKKIATSLHQINLRPQGDGLVALNRRFIADRLQELATLATTFLFDLDVNAPADAFVAEYERAARKHPGMTLDADGHTDETRFYALAEEVGEVAASLTYDNARGTGHQADTIAEVTQVGALALAWLTRYQDGEER